MASQPNHAFWVASRQLFYIPLPLPPVYILQIWAMEDNLPIQTRRGNLQS